MKITERIRYVKEILERNNFSSIEVKDILIESSDEKFGRYKVEACRGEYRIVIFERIRNGIVYKYAYALLRGDVCALMYDNAPHHRDVSTFPHHKHVFDRVEPLYDSSIESFLREVKRFLLDVS